MDIVETARVQMLGQLMDALAGGAARTAAAAQVTLAQGEAVTAAVVGELPDGQLALRLQGQTIVADVRGLPLPAELRQPGATLQLRVDAAGPQPQLSVLAAAPAKAAMTAKPIEMPPSGIPQATPRAEALAAATAQAALRQGSAAPLYADLAALAQSSTSVLPEPLERLAARILANRIDGDAPVTAAEVKRAVQHSGVFAEAQAARGAPLPDTKTLLLALRDMLGALPPSPQAAGRTPPAALPAGQTPDAPPELPWRDAGITAQKPVAPSPGLAEDPATAAMVVAREAGQAAERITLHQLASLPEQRAGGPDPARPQHLSLELPVQLAGQTAIAGLKVERETRRRTGDPEAVDIWGIRFAIETDAIGAVHAHLRLSGGSIAVSLWADDALTHGAFVSALPKLEAALRHNALEPGELMVFPGRPHEATPRRAPGRLLDLTS